jgi:hypothetical protein
MKSSIRVALACVACVLATSAAAQAPEHSITLNPAGPAMRASAEVLTPYRTSSVDQRNLSISAARALLSSTEGPAWRMVSVSAPRCSTEAVAKFRKANKKVELKNCRQMKADCNKAMKFAAKNKIHAACSSLYSLTTVAMATRIGGVK